MIRRGALLVLAASVIPACQAGKAGSPGPAGPSGVVINSITASPPVVRPGDSMVLSVSASDGSGGALTYAWSAPSGLLSSGSGNPVTWTAPGTTGSHLVNVTVTNGGGSSALGYVSLLVTVSPSGPIITSVNPGVVWTGDSVRITGAGFGISQGTSTVTFGGVVGVASSWAETEIRAAVPPGAMGSISVLVTVAGVPSSPGYLVVGWSGSNPSNVPICTAANNQRYPDLIPDGSGGAIIVWQDYRYGAFSDIFAQKVNGAGVVQWAVDVPVCTAVEDQTAPHLISDGSGGAIIVWQDHRTGGGATDDIYAQRLNGAGVSQWAAGGVPICTAASLQNGPRIVSDGAGGAVIAWQDYRAGGTSDIYAQRVDGAGAVQWTADGVPLCVAANVQANAQLTPDGTGGAIVVWHDARSGTYHDIFAQRVNGAGAVQWAADGNLICTAANLRFDPKVVGDGSGGGIIVWDDSRSGTSDVYAQRVNGAGAVQWAVNGIAVCLAANGRNGSQLVSDGSGGAIIVWNDFRSGSNNDIYVQRLDGSGAPQWTATGAPVCTAANDQLTPAIAPDGSGGAIITWQDDRSVGASDIYAQRVSSAGAVDWGGDGVAICTALNVQQYVQLVQDGSGGAIIVWMDHRNGTNDDIYAQGITGAGDQ